MMKAQREYALQTYIITAPLWRLPVWPPGKKLSLYDRYAYVLNYSSRLTSSMSL